MIPTSFCLKANRKVSFNASLGCGKAAYHNREITGELDRSKVCLLHFFYVNTTSCHCLPMTIYRSTQPNDKLGFINV